MKKLVTASLLAVLLAACAESGQGNAPGEERGTNRSTEAKAVDPANPPVPGTRPVVSGGVVSETPARPAPVPSGSEAKQTTEPDTAPVEQGAQTAPEPKTGDDANPDAVNPRR